MEKFSFFNDVNNDRVYYAEDFARHLARYFTNGVFDNSCLVLANNENMTLNVSSGSANINGYRYDNDSNKVLTIENADGVLNRIDNIVIRLDLTNRTITSQVIKGSFAENPTAPDLVRTSTIYDLRIAKVSIPAGTTTITQDLVTDTRFITSDCGNVICAVQTPNTEQLFIQIQTAFANQLDAMESATSDFETSSSAQLQTQSTTFSNKISGYDSSFSNKMTGYDTTFTNDLEEWSSDFDTWFNNIKDKLDGNTAAKLQNEIDAINNKALVEDADYVHTDNNYSNAEKEKVSTAETDITNLKKKLVYQYSLTLLATNWIQNTTTNYYEYNVIKEGITSNILVNVYADLDNQEKLSIGHTESYDGGFKIVVKGEVTEDAVVTVTYQLTESETVVDDSEVTS